jgi:hypothetical protein
MKGLLGPCKNPQLTMAEKSDMTVVKTPREQVRGESVRGELGWIGLLVNHLLPFSSWMCTSVKLGLT